MGNDTNKKPVLVIGGPTASGKSGLSLLVAEQLNGVVINCDSMQVYNALPILTAQPTQQDFERAPHKLYSIFEPLETCDAAKWRELAIAEINAAHAQNQLPIIAGGTGFYIKALLHGLSPIPDIDPEIRATLSKMREDLGIDEFFKAFAEIDPVMAARIDSQNGQRITRAWEVLEGTGKSLAEWQSVPPIAPPDDLAFTAITLLPDREALYNKCNTRFEWMFNSGAIDEVAEFKEKYPTEEMSLKNALGYREVCAYLEGTMSKPDAIEKSQQITRRYAKRQMTWLRNQIEADMIITDPKNETADLVALMKQKC